MICIELPPQTAIATERHTIAPPDYLIGNLIGTSSSTWSLYQATSCTTKRRAMQTDTGSLSDEATSRLEIVERAHRYIEDVTEMQDSYVMSTDDMDFLETLGSADFVPLTSDQSRLLPVRNK
jgi:hypothetical protein